MNKMQKKEAAWGYLFIAPLVLGLLVFSIFPIHAKQKEAPRKARCLLGLCFSRIASYSAVLVQYIKNL